MFFEGIHLYINPWKSFWIWKTTHKQDFTATTRNHNTKDLARKQKDRNRTNLLCWRASIWRFALDFCTFFGESYPPIFVSSPCSVGLPPSNIHSRIMFYLIMLKDAFNRRKKERKVKACSAADIEGILQASANVRDALSNKLLLFVVRYFMCMMHVFCQWCFFSSELQAFRDTNAKFWFDCAVFTVVRVVSNYHIFVYS